jgi:[ribosomal protein S18]-alanine N-acetyltransferase
MPYFLEPMRVEDIPEVATIERLCFSMPWPTSAYRRELKTPETNRYVVARFVPPEVAASLGMQEPTVDNLTRLSHPEQPSAAANGTGGGKVKSDAGRGGGRSLLATLLPWLRKAENGQSETPNPSPFPIVGYAGLWLMVDEAHVTTIGVHPDHRGRGVGELLFLALTDLAYEIRAFRMTLEVRVSNTSAQALYRKFGMENAGVRKRYYSDNGEDAYIMWSEPINSPQFRSRTGRLRAELAERMRHNFFVQPPPARPVDARRLQ